MPILFSDTGELCQNAGMDDSYRTIIGADEFDPDTTVRLGDLYKPGEDGSYRLSVEGVGGYNVEDVSGLKSALAKKAAKADELKSRIEAFGDLTPDEALEMRQRIAALDDATPDAKLQAKLESERKQLTAKHSQEAESWRSRESSLIAALESKYVDAEISAVVAAHGGRLPLLQAELRSKVRMIEREPGRFETVIIDSAGAPELTKKAGDYESPMTLAELVSEMSKDPVWAPAFAPPGPSGSGSPSNMGSKAVRSNRMPEGTSPLERLTRLREQTG